MTLLNIASYLPDHDEIVSFSNLQRVLIYFYPKAMTPDCTIQACGLHDNVDNLKKVRKEEFSISIDKSEKLFRFLKKRTAKFRFTVR